MKKIYPTMACFLQLCLSGCIDYVKVEEDIMFPPRIDTRNLSPHPTRLVDTISVGKNCNGQIFKVPPIEGGNTGKLYYLWFIDGKLASPIASIEPEARSSSIVTLTIDEQFLRSHLQNKFPADFFERPHMIEFFVSDIKYDMPEIRYIKDENYNEKDHSDYAYWLATFTNDPC